MLFNGQIYSNVTNYCDDVVTSYMYADGCNDHKQVKAAFDRFTDQELIDDMLAQWCEMPAMMQFYGVSRDDMESAMHALRLLTV